MSNLEDSRVLSAFSAQQNALPYMVNVEQRLSRANTSIADLILNLDSLEDRVDSISQITGLSLTASKATSGSFVSTFTTFTDAYFPLLTLNSPGGRPVLILCSLTEAFVNSTLDAYLYLAVKVDSGTDDVVMGSFAKANMAANNSGLCFVTSYFNVSAGSHTYQLRAKTSSGTFTLSTPGVMAVINV